MGKRKKSKRMKEIKNYLTFVAAGVLLVVIVALVSGCGSRSFEDDSDSGHRKVLSKSEIQRLTDLVVTDATEDDSSYEDEEGLGILTDEFDSNSHYTYIWGWEDLGEDEVDEDSQILAQLSEDDQILQTFSEDELALYPDKKAKRIVEFQGATDRELVFCVNFYMDKVDPYIWYRIPLSYENGQEKLLCDQKEVIYEEKGECSSLAYGAGKYLFCEDEKGCFVIDQESGEKQRVVEDSKQLSYGYNETEPWVSPEGDVYVLLNGYRDSLIDSFYAYQVGKEGIQEISGGISTASRTAFGDGKLFFTRLVDSQMRDNYNIYVYDMVSGRKKVLVSEAEIREILPEEPSENADFLREIAYAQGNLYLEIRYGGQTHVLSCDVDEGSLTILSGLPELVRHREYQIPEAIEDGNRKYYNVNDHNIFERSEDGIVERTLDGAYVRTIRLPYYFVYANNRELIYSFEPEPCGGDILYSVPLISLDGNDYPDINHMEKILDQVGDNVSFRGYLYADEQYLIYITNGHEFTVYDRQAKAFVDVADLPRERHTFLSGDATSDMSGEYVFFNSKSESRKTDKFGFSLYHFGDKRVTRIDPRCYPSASAYWCEDGKTIVYESHSDDNTETLEICSYDIDTGDRNVLFTREDLLATLKQASGNQDIKIYFADFFASDKIYYIGEASKSNECWVVSYDLAGEGKLEYEAQISEFINTDLDLELWDVAVAEGKLFMKKSLEDEEGEEKLSATKYYYYDLSTGKHTEFRETDREGLYLSLVDLD